MRSLLSRRLSRLIALALFALFPATAAFPLTSSSTPFTGVVKDSVGSLLEDVEVLVVDRSAGTEPLATARSDNHGRFRVEGLPEGSYRIAALKQGYLTFVGRVDTRLQQWIQVVLHPMPDVSEALDPAVPEDASWVYRLPRRYVLESRTPEPGDEPDPDAGLVAESTERDALRMQVDQLFSLPTTMSDREALANSRGSQTRVKLASPIGDHGSLDVHGYRDTFGSTSEEQPAVTTASRAASSLAVNFAYATGSDGQLAVRAFYNERVLEYDAAPIPAADPVAAPPGSSSSEQGHRQWGYDARWSTRLDGESRLAVGLNYQDTTFLAGGRFPQPNPLLGDPNVPEGVVARAVGASGIYESEPIDNHAVEIGVRARVLETANPYAGALGAVPAQAYLTLSGLAVGITAQDTWDVAGPFSLIYGLGYRHAATMRDDSLIVPRVGGSWSIDGAMLRVLVSYYGVARTGRVAAYEPFDTSGPVAALGYDAELELPLPARLRLAGATRHSPVQFDYLGYAGSAALEDQRPIYISDGTAAVTENRIGLMRETRRLRTFLEFTRGRVQGSLAAMTPFDVPQDFLTASALDYGTGRLGFSLLDTGTDLLFQVERLVQTPDEWAGGAAETSQRAVEVRVSQELLDIRSIGNWRFLVAVRQAAQDSGESREASDRGALGALASVNHRFSAGLSVSF